MLTAIFSFIKSKLFSTSGVFLLIFAAIISIFIFFNSNIILSKFGFETTTTLKSELTRTQSELEQLKSINNDLNNNIKLVEDRYKKQLLAITTLQEEKIAMENKVNTIVKTYTTTKNKLNKDIKVKVQESPTDITLPIEEINQLSVNNISAINTVYSELFES